MTAELKSILAFFILGIAIGVLFDLFRISRKTIHTSNLITCIEDSLFWILAGLLILYTLFYYTDGIIRFYMILIAILGWIIYLLTISRFIILICTKSINYIKRLFSTFFNKISEKSTKIKSKIFKKFSKNCSK